MAYHFPTPPPLLIAISVALLVMAGRECCRAIIIIDFRFNWKLVFALGSTIVIDAMVFHGYNNALMRMSRFFKVVFTLLEVDWKNASLEL